MVAVWNQGDPEASYSINVTCPKEFEAVINEAQAELKAYRKSNRSTNNIFEHPSLNLESLYDNARSSGALLSTTDFDTVKEGIQEIETQIDLLSSEIKNTISSLVQLCRSLTKTTSRFTHISSQKALYNFLLKPGRQFPQDILDSIFTACMQTHRNTTSPSTPPLQLASVCSHWRQVACSMSSLWKFVRVDNAKPTSFEQAKLWLTRSRSPNLTLRLSANDDSLSGPIDDLFSFLRKESIELGGLDVDITPGPKADELLPIIITHPSCKSLQEIVMNDSTWYRPVDVPLHVKRLYLAQPSASWSKTSIHSTNVTLLVLSEELHWGVVDPLLRSFPALQKLFLTLSGTGVRHVFLNSGHTDPNNWRPNSRVFYPELQYLGISNDCTGSVDLPDSFLQRYTFASLQMLDYFGLTRRNTAPIWLISHPLLGQIRRLSVHLNFVLTKDIILSILHPAHSLQELSMTSSTSSLQCTLEALTSIPAAYPHSTFLPLLKTFHYASALSFDDLQPFKDDFERLIQSWTPPAIGSALQVNLRPHHLLNLNIHHWIDRRIVESTQADGLDTHHLCQNLQAVSPDVTVQLIISSLYGEVPGIPILFDVTPPSSRIFSTHKVMGPEGEWRERSESIYNIV
ncbi:hypothetical protein BDN72DRAFT_901585 [Pluteus cervinus]|uniref:Uncharacterized protein n=2 Tax=Pluteus cervinus TaxID=181527 RepID=A0ACD3AFD5_9AGAR|nr:hypothetical protein BDN72DRAFT_904350 [Pluteus cervinus]TFK64378.1 hypothetical protein BDN72DRAFT_901585 [Pluteus cervinus]